MEENTEISKLAYELTLQTHLLNRDKNRSLFTQLSIPEYILLYGVTQTASDQGRVYLKDLSRRLELPMSRLSGLAGGLKERGLVQWSHDGKGNDGTYLVITDSGRQAMARQEALLTGYYTRVAAEFGRENLTHLLQQMKTLGKIMDEAFEGGTEDGSEQIE